MKKVLVPLAISDNSPDTLGREHFVRQTYLERFFRYELTPLLVSPYTPANMTRELLSEAQGLFLLGGMDLNPEIYGASPHERTEVGDIRRDRFEIELIKTCLQLKKPIFGICRGLQIMAVATGGSLYQHVPDLKLNEEHGLEEGKHYKDLVMNKTHAVILDKNSKAAKILKSERIEINSFHHQAVKDPGSVFIVSGRSPEGVVEIIEHPDQNYFAIGVQGHPETFDSDQEALMAEFARQIG